MNNNRPLSPHLSIHKKVLTAIFSIFHRITGIGLSLGSILISIWIAFIALGEEYFSIFQTILSSLFFTLVLILWTIGIFYHLFNGIRYLFWSFGYGLELKIVNNTSYFVVILTVLSTIIVWVVIQFMSNYSFKWIVQRITAVLLIPLTFWFVYNCILFSRIGYNELIVFFNSYINCTLFLIMMVSMLIHAQYGCETIIEDYVLTSSLKKNTIFIIRLVAYSAIIITVISILSILSSTS